MATASAMLFATAKSCVMNSMAMPRSRCSSRRSSSTCAWIVTSSAVVGSSAISSSGSAASAPAIITRCFIPPDSWCGYSYRRRRGSGTRTASSNSSARAMLALRDSLRCRRNGSQICWPTVITGFSDIIGSWKIMPIVAPRIPRICTSGSSSRSCPFSRISPDSIRAASGSSRITLSAVTDLPLPDSPSSAKVPCFGMEKLMSSTATSRSGPVPNATRRCLTSSRALIASPSGRMRRALRPTTGSRTAPGQT